jgi:phage/plasmid-associated DNA primase
MAFRRASGPSRCGKHSYQAQSNPIADFVTEVCILDPSAFTTVGDLRGAYASWVHETGQRTLFGRTEFVAALREVGCTPATRPAGRGWAGIGLRPDANSLYNMVRKTAEPTLAQLFDSEETVNLSANAGT